MATGQGSFTSPSAAPPKSKYGRVKPDPGSDKKGNRFGEKPLDPLRFASATIPSFASRRRATNGKSGFNTKPARLSWSSRKVDRPGKVSRGDGKEHRATL